MKRIFTFLTLTFCFSLCGFGQITWTKTQGPYGGYVKNLVVHPTNFTAYALAGNNGGGKLYRSTDNGGTWIEQTPLAFGNDAGRFNDVEVLADGTLFVLAYNNLYKSTDDGLTWAKINTGTSSTANGFDQGQQFSKNNFSGTLYVAGYDYGNSKQTLFRSTDGGSTFTKGYADPSGYSVTQIAITGNGDVYAIIGGKLMRSADDGSTFTAVSTPLDANSVVSLTATQDGSQLAMVTYTPNMYTLTSTIASPSTTWSVALTVVGITNPTTFGSGAMIRYSPDKTTMFLMDNQNNRFYSRTSGSWTPGSTTFVTSNGEDAICFASKDATTLYVGTNDIGVWKSINAGSGWIESDAGIESSSFNNIVVADDGSIITAGQRTYRSTDNGTSWTRNSSVTSGGYYAFKATAGSPKPIALLGQNGQASFRSTNNGTSWSPIAATPGNAYNFYSADGTKIYGFGNSQFFYTSDQGTTWSAALTITSPPVTWPTGSFNVQYAAVDQNSVIYIYLYDAGTFKFFKMVPNSTTTPTQLTPTQIQFATIGVTSVNAMGYVNNTVYVSGYPNSGNALSSTTNAGTSWTVNTSAPQANRIDADPLNNYLFLTNGNNNSFSVNLSRDGGSTFSSSAINASSNTSQGYGYALNSSGIAFAGVSNSSVYKTTGTIVIPLAPTSLINSGDGTDRVTLRWIDNATNEDHFIIEKFNGTSYDSVGYQNSNFTTGAKVYYEVKNLLANTSYTFRVSAKNAAGSTSATPLTLSTLTQCATTVPDNRSWNGSIAASGTPSSATLSNISIKSLGNGFFSVSDIVNGTASGQNTNISGIFFESCGNTYLTPGGPLQPNTDGTWTSGTNTLILKWITANSITPETTGTVTLTVAGSDPIPAAPSSPTAYVYNNTSIEVSWIGSAFETQYIVERSLSNTFGTIDRTITVNYPSTSVVDNTGLANGTTYYYRVKAKNNAGTSSPSSTFATITLTQPYFTLSGTTIESTLAYSTTGPIWGDFNNDGFDDVIMPQLTFFQGTPSLPLAFKNDGAGNFVSVAPTGITPST